VETVEGDMFAQYGSMNFHAKRDGGSKLSLAIKNKQLPSHRSSIGGKSVYVLHSRMSTLDYIIELEVECHDDDANDATFVRAIAIIGGRDTVEEFMASKMYPLAVGFGLHGVAIDTTSMLKVQTPLPLFLIEAVPMGDASRVLEKVETEVERFLGSIRP
jgi:hypothetical protein